MWVHSEFARQIVNSSSDREIDSEVIDNKEMDNELNREIDSELILNSRKNDEYLMNSGET